MEEVIVKELADKLSSMLAEKIVEEVWLVTSFKESFEFICEEVNSIKCLLTDARATRTSNSSSLTNWLNRLEDFLTDAVDIVEECEQRKFGFLNIIFRYRMGRRIRKLRERITMIHTGAKYLKYLTSLNATTVGVQALNAYIESSEENKRRKSSALLSQFQAVGIKQATDKVSGWILEDGFKVIAIVGMGGLGKTLLVQEVFNSQKVRDSFDHLVWLTVSPKFVVEELLLLTCRQIKLPEETEGGEKGIKERINKYFEGKNKNLELKRCLFVLDDVWDKKAWEKIGLQFPLESKTKVVVTTRDNKIAQAMQASRIHHMEFLSENDSWKLFCIHSNFPDGLDGSTSTSLEHPMSGVTSIKSSEHPMTRVTSIARGIVHKCSGLPLAIKTIGASMTSVRRLPNEWESILDRLKGAEPITESVMPSLRLSYEALPDPLKPCFLYCCSFPPNTEIKSEYLAHLWVAEGLVSTSSHESVDAVYEVARSYIDQLIGRCVIESSQVGRDGRVQYCKMHDLLHELALGESHKETKSLSKPGHELNELPVNECQGVRRISLIKNNLSTIKEAVPACRGLRSLLLCNNIKLERISESFYDNLRYLTVLDLSQTSIQLVPTSIGNLKHLKFLNLSKTNIEKLPNSLSGLKHLQFLDVSGCQQLTSMHFGIDGHKSMVYLNVKGCTSLKSLPAGISKLVHLRTLKGALLFKGDQLKAVDAALQWTDLKGLTRLQHLSLTLDVQSSSQGELKGTLVGMTKMRTLSIKNISPSCLLHLPEDMQSMQRLEIIRLRKCAVPKWVLQLENLVFLLLEDDNSSTEYEEYEGLQIIPNLKELRLSRNSKRSHFPRGFGERMAFSKLETLIIEDFSALETFPLLEDGAMPRLKHLRMKNCNRLKQMPQALQYLTSLEEIEVECCPEWEDGFWLESVQRDLIWKIFHEHKIKLTIDNFVISIQKNIENDSKLKSAKDNLTVSILRRDRSIKRGWFSQS